MFSFTNAFVLFHHNPFREKKIATKDNSQHDCKNRCGPENDINTSSNEKR